MRVVRTSGCGMIAFRGWVDKIRAFLMISSFLYLFIRAHDLIIRSIYQTSNTKNRRLYNKDIKIWSDSDYNWVFIEESRLTHETCYDLQTINNPPPTEIHQINYNAKARRRPIENEKEAQKKYEKNGTASRWNKRSSADKLKYFPSDKRHPYLATDDKWRGRRPTGAPGRRRGPGADR